MANHFDVAKADRETIRQNGYCQMYAERGFNIIGAYPTAFAAYQAVPQKRGGTPPNDGNYYLIYFDGWYNLGEGMQQYGDIAVYRNGQVWSGSSLSFRVNPVSFDYYKSWIGTAYLCWSEYLGNRKIATIGGETVAKPTHKEVLTHFRKYQGTDPTQKQQDYYAARDWGVLNGDLLQLNFDRVNSLKKQLSSDENGKKIQAILNILK